MMTNFGFYTFPFGDVVEHPERVLEKTYVSS